MRQMDLYVFPLFTAEKMLSRLADGDMHALWILTQVLLGFRHNHQLAKP